MKVSVLVNLVLSVKAIYPPISCFTCRAKTVDGCASSGNTKVCNPNQEVCQLQVRKRGGRVLQIQMGCKQHRACENNKANNFVGTNPRMHQCKPKTLSTSTPSVCRQCCDKNSNCAINFLRWNPKLGGPQYMKPWKRSFVSKTLEENERLTANSQNYVPVVEEDKTVTTHYGGIYKGVSRQPTGFQVSREEEEAAVERLFFDNHIDQGSPGHRV